MPKKEITMKQRLFVIEYLQCRNATKAAVKAGYSPKTARSAGSRLLTNVDISIAIEKGVREQLERADITSDHIMMALKRVAFSDYGVVGRLRALELLGKSLGIFKNERHFKLQPTTLSVQPIQASNREKSVLDLLVTKF